MRWFSFPGEATAGNIIIMTNRTDSFAASRITQVGMKIVQTLHSLLGDIPASPQPPFSQRKSAPRSLGRTCALCRQLGKVPCAAWGSATGGRLFVVSGLPKHKNKQQTNKQQTNKQTKMHRLDYSLPKLLHR